MTARILEFKAAQTREAGREKIQRISQEFKSLAQSVFRDLDEDPRLGAADQYKIWACNILISQRSATGLAKTAFGAFYIAHMRMHLAHKWLDAMKSAKYWGNTFPELEKLERFKFDIAQQDEFSGPVKSLPSCATECFQALTLSHEAIEAAKNMQKPIADGLALRRNYGTDFRVAQLPACDGIRPGGF